MAKQSAAARVRVDVDGPVAYVRLNRPDKRNGLDLAMFRALTAAARDLRRNRQVQVVILSGQGADFCAGLDFSDLGRHPGNVPRLFLKWPWRRDNLAQRIAHCWRALPVPVICVIHGHCLGGGLQIALACDFRIAHPDATLSVRELQWGLIPDMSGTIALARLTRLDIAQELTMTARQFSASEGFEYGLITRLADDPLAVAEDLARQIAARSPDAIAAAKLLFRHTWQAEEQIALRWERRLQARLLGRKNQRIAMRSARAEASEPTASFRPRRWRWNRR